MKVILIVLIACILTSIITLTISNRHMQISIEESEAEMWDEFMKDIKNENKG